MHYNCQLCSAILQPGQNFCPNCGTKFEQPVPALSEPKSAQFQVSPATEKPPTAPKKQSFGVVKGCLLVIVIIFVAVIVAAGIDGHTSDSGATSDDSSTSANTSSSAPSDAPSPTQDITAAAAPQTDTPPPAPTWHKVLVVRGDSTKNTETFTVGSNWEIEWDTKPGDRECLEYIVLHEMVHLIEPTHNSRFLALMDIHMPDWPARRDLLNTLPVRHEKWVY